MALITVPSFLKSSMESASLTLQRTDFQMRSAFTRQRQVLSWPSGHMWTASCTVPNLKEPESGLMRAFLAKLGGRANTFQMPVPGYTRPANDYAGPAGLVNGAGQSGYSVATDGWTAGAAILPEGSYITVGGELKLVTAAVTANGSGQATIPIEPPLRYAPADNSAIVITEPYVIMSMSDQNGASWGLRAPRFHGFELSFEEAVNLP